MAKKKILVIDDETEFCELVKKFLERQNDFEVSTCSEGTRAVDQTKRFKPDLVLLDVRMPEVSGTDIAETLRGNEATKNIPIIFLTAIVTEEDVQKSDHKIGGEYFLSKPVRIEELLALVKKLSSHS